MNELLNKLDRLQSSPATKRVKEPLVNELTGRLEAARDLAEFGESTAEKLAALVGELNENVDNIRSVCDESRSMAPSQPIASLDSDALQALQGKIDLIKRPLMKGNIERGTKMSRNCSVDDSPPHPSNFVNAS